MLGLVAILSGTLMVLAWIGWCFFVREGEKRVQAASVPVPSVLRHRVGWTGFGQLGLALIVAACVAAAVTKTASVIAGEQLFAQNFLREAHIRAALNPEKLAPPPPLPARMFLGTEIPALETADRNWEKLEPEFQQRALIVFARVEARGYPLALLEGYRSPERQELLAGLGPHVTQARAFQSQHQYGLALDAAPVLNGRLVISERDPSAMQAYQALGEEAERAGLVWGGRWSLRDYGHIEAPGRARDAQVRK